MLSQDILKDLGFSDKEVLVYLALLESDTATAAEIAKKTGLNRTSSYDILSALGKRGLMSKVKKHGKIHFQAADPRKLATYLDREKADFDKKIEEQKIRVQEIIPELSSLIAPTSARPRVQFFEGEKGMREAYEDTLTSKEAILAYANVETMHKGLPKFFPEYYKRRAEAGIFIRAIFADNEPSRERAEFDKDEMRETRFMPREDWQFSPEVNIYHDKMLVASWKEKMAVIIESKELAELQKMIFETVWSSLAK